MQEYDRTVSPGTSLVWTPRPPRVSVLEPERAARMDARRARDLARGLRDAVELVDGPAAIDDGHQQHQEDRDPQRELHDRLPGLTVGARRRVRASAVTA